MKTNPPATKEKDKKTSLRFEPIDSMEKLATRHVLKNDRIPFSTRKKDIEEMLEHNNENQLVKDTIEESNFRFSAEDGMGMVVNSNERELKKYDSDVSINIADYSVVNENAKRFMKTLDTVSVEKETKTQKELLNLDNIDPVIQKLLQGKNAEEIKIGQNPDFEIDLKSKASMQQVQLRADVLAKLFIIYNKDDYQNMSEKIAKNTTTFADGL